MGEIVVGLVFGGRSGEHEVSIVSARAIARGLAAGNNGKKYRICPFYIQKNGVWQGPQVAQGLLGGGSALAVAEAVSPEALWTFPPEVAQVQVWLPVLHGPNGEDGTIQGLFTLMQTPFVGSGVLGSAVGMDKIAMKMAFAQLGLPQVDYVAVDRDRLWSGTCFAEAIYAEIEENLGYPCFVKPANLGSSVGIGKVRDRSELQTALDEAAHYDPRIIVEAGVTAREIECGVLGNGNPQASVVGEITFNSDFYDYETKYTDGQSQLHIPADLPEGVVKQVQELAIAAFQGLGCRGLSRVDFFYNEASGQIWINEINTFPGFTSLSMYPQLWQASGVEFPDLVDRLIQLALEK